MLMKDKIKNAFAEVYNRFESLPTTSALIKRWNKLWVGYNPTPGYAVNLKVKYRDMVVTVKAYFGHVCDPDGLNEVLDVMRKMNSGLDYGHVGFDYCRRFYYKSSLILAGDPDPDQIYKTVSHSIKVVNGIYKELEPYFADDDDPWHSKCDRTDLSELIASLGLDGPEDDGDSKSADVPDADGESDSEEE